MAVPLLDLQAQYASLRADIDGAVEDVIQSQRFVLGPVVERFEQQMGEFVGTRHAIGCASGTDALLLALRALGLEPGSEVIVPTFTFFATAGAVWNAGLRPVFVDVQPDTFNMSADAVEAALTSRTRAIVVVHLFGQMADMPPLLEIARRNELFLIEDVAQALGARQQMDGSWETAGNLGDLGCFSFFPAKTLGAFGDAGLVTTNDDSLAETVRKLRVHGGRQMYHHDLVGTNSRLDALQASVLTAKLPRVPGWLEARRSHAAAYAAALERLPQVQSPRTLSQNQHTFNVFTIRAERRDELKAWLDTRGIGNAVYYPVPLHLQPCFETLGYRPGEFPVSERAAKEVLSLPVYPELRGEQIDEVVRALTEFYAYVPVGRATGNA